MNFTNWRRNLWRRQAATKASWLNISVSQRGMCRSCLMVTTTIACQNFLNWLSRLEWSGRRNGLSLLSLLSLKKTRGRKTTLLFCFLFSVSCVFYITGFFQLYWFFPIVFYILAFPNYIGFSQLYFIYWLFPIILCFFPNCLYSAPVNCPIKKMAPVARSFMM